MFVSVGWSSALKVGVIPFGCSFLELSLRQGELCHHLHNIHGI